MNLDLSLILIVSLLAGAFASVSGFGIGSLLTPLFALKLDLQLAVAAVSIPHLLGTAVRFALIRKSLRKDVFIGFGIWSAIGALTGALLHNVANNPVLIIVFASLLITAGVTGVLGLSSKIQIPPKLSWLAGLASGAFGGLVGNQGGIRSASLLGFDLSKAEFIATATAIGLIVDGARMPVYFSKRFTDLVVIWQPIAVASSGVLLGTWLGKTLLAKLPELIFKRFISGIILVLGLAMLIQVSGYFANH
jgi:uncharacterized membrane protein YfcA